MASNLENIFDTLREQSGQLGAQEANLKNLGRNFDRHCADDDQRHTENVAELRSIGKTLRELHDLFQPVAGAVAVMKPVVDGYQVTRTKFIGGLFVVGLVVSAVGWIITSILGKLVEAAVKKIGL